ncbi:MAG: GNAT family N-acetyltransferase [Patescibacteria group bacterium]|jgi:N-acetylglutamate synthase-like GNAT family acetyltransferase|nr:GNAT family N-acetyltransferase [Patescibacteria group bacterium]
MTRDIAEQIANLLNSRNQLVVDYTADKVLESKSNYVYLEDENEVIACAESKKIQWYQSEISHVSVLKKVEGKGKGKEILSRAERKAKNDGAKLLQCTIRTNNENSLRLFLRMGYEKVNRFFYPNSGNWVYVLQKSISNNV